MKNTITLEEVSKLLTYDPKTGDFHWAVNRGGKTKAGDKAGWSSLGYTIIRIGGVNFKAHRLAWLFVHGEMPNGHLDHINRIRNDNRIKNLRIATPSQNIGNSKMPSTNSSGVKGVSWCAKAKKWIAFIAVNSRNRNLGSYETIQEAAAAYKGAAKVYFGKFAHFDRT